MNRSAARLLTSLVMFVVLVGLVGGVGAARAALPLKEEGFPTLAPLIDETTPAVVNISVSSLVPAPGHTAVSPTATKKSRVEPPVAGAEHILPNLEVGQVRVQQLESLAGVRAAGRVLGARVPIVLSGPSDTEGTLTASCALAVLLAHVQKRIATIDKPPRPVPSP